MKPRCVVVGSGLAGCLVANELANSFDVVVLERGPSDSTLRPQVKYVGRELAHVQTFCYGAGGTTNLWHNGLIPLRTEDIPSPELRTVLEDADRFINLAASRLHFTSGSFVSDFGSLLAQVAEIGADISHFPDGTDCLVYPKRFRPLRPSRDTTAYYGVSNIGFCSQAGRISSVSFNVSDDEYSVKCDFLIVCAGALGTPPILVEVLRQMGDSNDSIGRGLIDHPMGFVGKFRFPKRVAARVKTFSLLDKGDYESRNVIRLKSKCGMYTGCAFFRPSATISNDLKTHVYKSLLGASKGTERIRNALSPRILHPDILTEIVSHLFPFAIPTRTYSVLFIGEQRRGNNRVYRKKNELYVDWSITENEMDIYRSMIGELQDHLSDVAEAFAVKTDLSQEWLWSAAHHSGTVKIGDDDEGILDQNLKVKTTDNVFVCDGSVIHEHSYANTGLTIAQLAMRLAHLLKSQSNVPGESCNGQYVE